MTNQDIPKSTVDNFVKDALNDPAIKGLLKMTTRGMVLYDGDSYSGGHQTVTLTENGLHWKDVSNHGTSRRDGIYPASEIQFYGGVELVEEKICENLYKLSERARRVHSCY